MAVKVRQKREAASLVIWITLGLMLLAMSLLVSKLWRLQVRGKRGFDAVFHNQSVRRVRLPAVRGTIYDATGMVLADSVPNYSVAIYTEEMRAPRSALANTLELIHKIWQATGAAPDVGYRDIKRHFALNYAPRGDGSKDYEPLVVWRKLDDEKLGKWQNTFGRWNDERTVPGLEKHDPLSEDGIALEINELSKRATSTAANTLELVYEIAERTGLDRTKVRYQKIVNHIYAQKPLPFLAWENIDDETMALWADTCSTLPGTDIYCQPARVYPGGDTNAHFLGYTKRADAIREEAETGETIHFDMRGIKGVGQGLEYYYDDLLEGESGYKLVRIDASGYHHSDLTARPSVPGGDLRLAIDQNIQRFAMEALATKQNGEDPYPVRGACVVLNPNNGDVLAMVSSPSFDPNLFMRSPAYASALFQDQFATPTYNRAVFGQYPPGSTFKPIAALGVLRAQLGYTNVVHDCHSPWYVDQEKRRWKKDCWIHRPPHYNQHGETTIRQAMTRSCNVFMYEMAMEAGFEPIRAMASEFGLGHYAGLFPNLEAPPATKDAQYGNLPDKANNKIDLCNMAIGQGAILASPLQMAMVASTIANGGRLYRPRLVKEWRNNPDEAYQVNPTWAIRKIDIPIEALEEIRGGMFDVVNHEDGSAKKLKLDEILVAGKTGSAQYKKKVNGEVKNSVHAWMISYAPYHFPRYAIAMVVEDGVSGGRSIGPRLNQLYSKIFEYDGTLRKEET